MNEIIQAMQERRSSKQYTTQLPPHEMVAAVVDAGLWAANGRGEQKTISLVVTNRELRDQLSQLNCQVGGWSPDVDPFYGAPIVIVVLAPKGSSHGVHDGSLVMGNMMLAAHSLGLGSCWIHRALEMFNLDAGRSILTAHGIDPDQWEGVGNLILGYTAGNPRPAAPRHNNRVIEVD